MEADVYKAPESEILTENSGETEFYVVSQQKFLILYIATLGLYSFYWFYKHWQQYKIRHQESMWPIMRAIFQIFFTHSLFENFRVRLMDKKLTYAWAPGVLATIYVVIILTESVANRMSIKGIGLPLTDYLGFLLFPLQIWILYKAQGAANVACECPKGEKNSLLTAANYFWIVVGGVFWLLVAIGLYETYKGIY